MPENERNELNRREFLRKAAITGAVAWAIPVVQSVAATPAYAQTGTTTCCHSFSGAGTSGCKEACTSSGAGCGGPCQTACTSLCPVGQGGCNPCSNPQACNPGCWQACSFTC